MPVVRYHTLRGDGDGWQTLWTEEGGDVPRVGDYVRLDTGDVHKVLNIVRFLGHTNSVVCVEVGPAIGHFDFLRVVLGRR